MPTYGKTAPVVAYLWGLLLNIMYCYSGTSSSISSHNFCSMAGINLQ